MTSINLKQLFDYDTCSFTYLLWDKKDKSTIIIDPVLEQTNRDLELIQKLGLNLIYILETHVHADHITGASILREKTGAKICYGSRTGVEGADLLLEDGSKIKFGDSFIDVLHTPGHTVGCTSYYINKYIFTGDTLFIEGTGRTDFQGGCSSSAFDSIRNKIFTFPKDTIVYPAHNYKGFNSSTIGHERKFNPNVADHVQKEDFMEREKNMNRPYPKRFDIAVPANLKCGKNS